MGRGKGCREETFLCPGGPDPVGAAVAKARSRLRGGGPGEEEGAPTRVVDTSGCRHHG